MKTGRPVADVLWETHPDIRVLLVGNPTCTDFEEYQEVPEMVPLDFSEIDVMWITSKISGTAGALGAESIKTRNWLLRFGYASDEFRVVVTDIYECMANSSLPGTLNVLLWHVASLHWISAHGCTLQG